MPELDDLVTGSEGQLEGADSQLLASGIREHVLQVEQVYIDPVLGKIAVKVDQYNQALSNPGVQDRAKDNISGATSITSQTCTTASQQLLAANTARKGLSLWYTGGNNCYIAVGQTAVIATAFSVILSAANRYFELPFGGQMAINQISDVASGLVMATEYL